jgi:molybdate transport system permease protein
VSASGGRAAARRPARGAPAAAALLGATLLGFVLAVPLVALFLHATPAALLARLREPALLEALWLSLATSTAATAIVVVLGTPLAYVLATRRFPGKRALEVLVDLPMVLPPTVAGFALLLAFGRAGLVGSVLAPFGIAIPFTTAAVVLAQVFMASPFYLATARAAFAGIDRRHLEAAATLGATESHTFRRVVLPLVHGALIAGTAMSWARALGEFGATITFAGNLPGVTQTMPLAVYVALQSDLEAAIALSVLLVLLAMAILVALRSRVTLPGAAVADGRRP